MNQLIVIIILSVSFNSKNCYVRGWRLLDHGAKVNDIVK